MLETIRDLSGEIKACCEWNLVDSLGNFSQSGNYVWISQMEISASSNGTSLGYVKDFVKMITTKAPNAQYGYFSRDKYNKRVKLSTRNRWLKFANGG